MYKIVPVSYFEIFQQQFPYYLSIGMTYDQYWNEDCLLVKYYRQADEIRNRRKNQDLWLQGLYIYEALCDVAPILHAFAKCGTKPIAYTTEPYPLTEKDIAEKKEREEKRKFEQMQVMMGAMAVSLNSKMKPGLKGSDNNG